jgi:pimeloyl-ACP methyl ester carboxylesterase
MLQRNKIDFSVNGVHYGGHPAGDPPVTLTQSFFTVAEQAAMMTAELLSPGRARRKVLDMTPDGDGHTVIGKMGFGVGAWLGTQTVSLMNEKGYRPVMVPGICNLTFNGADVDDTCRVLLRETDRSGEKATLWGYSAGGFNVCLAAHRHPDRVRNIILFGTPLHFNAPGHVLSPLKSAFQFLNPRTAREEAEIERIITRPIADIPRTMIVPEKDIFIHRRAMIGIPGPKTENILVLATHFGVNNPFSQIVTLDRVAQKRDTWQRFDEQRYSSDFLPMPRVIPNISLAA